jgi:hypothetical protein
VLVNIMLEIRENLPPRRDHPRAAFAPHRVTLSVKAVLGLSQVFRSYYLRAPKIKFTRLNDCKFLLSVTKTRLPETFSTTMGLFQLSSGHNSISNEKNHTCQPIPLFVGNRLALCTG